MSSIVHLRGTFRSRRDLEIAGRNAAGTVGAAEAEARLAGRGLDATTVILIAENAKGLDRAKVTMSANAGTLSGGRPTGVQFLGGIYPAQKF